MREKLVLLFTLVLILGFGTNTIAAPSNDDTIVTSGQSDDKKSDKKNGDEEPDCE